jgi:hypothetical protein
MAAAAAAAAGDTKRCVYCRSARNVLGIACGGPACLGKIGEVEQELSLEPLVCYTTRGATAEVQYLFLMTQLPTNLTCADCAKWSSPLRLSIRSAMQALDLASWLPAPEGKTVAQPIAKRHLELRTPCDNASCLESKPFKFKVFYTKVQTRADALELVIQNQKTSPPRECVVVVDVRVKNLTD